MADLSKMKHTQIQLDGAEREVIVKQAGNKAAG